jgi:hypothetical protein
LIKNWGAVLPTQSVCLRVPIVSPREHEEMWARRRRGEAEARRDAQPTAPANPDEGGRG